MFTGFLAEAAFLSTKDIHSCMLDIMCAQAASCWMLGSGKASKQRAELGLMKSQLPRYLRKTVAVYAWEHVKDLHRFWSWRRGGHVLKIN